MRLWSMPTHACGLDYGQMTLHEWGSLFPFGLCLEQKFSSLGIETAGSS